MIQLRKYVDPNASISTEAASTQQPAPTTNPNQTWARSVLGGPRRHQYATSTVNIQNEIQLYLRAEFPLSSNDRIDPLEFWTVSLGMLYFSRSEACQMYEKEFPTIFKLAMDVLPVQGSSVPCERVFSSAQETITPRRSLISPEVMEACQILKFGLKKNVTLSFTEGTDRASQVAALEALTNRNSEVPEPILYYAHSLSGLSNT
jgi:hypothetical protein